MSDEKKAYEITSEGSLGLLALGDIGIEKWREAKNKEAKETPNTQSEDGKETDQ